MGCVDTVKHDSFPKQGEWLHKRVKVFFHYETEHIKLGTIVRDDTEEPFRTIFRLDDGRYVLSSECQYSLND